MKIHSEGQNQSIAFMNWLAPERYLSGADEPPEFLVFPQAGWIAIAQTAERSSLLVFSSVAFLPAQKTIFIEELDSDVLSLVRPLPVSVELSPLHVIAYSDALKEFAWARDELSAIAELKCAIAELYFLLKEQREHLGVIPQRQWDFLQMVVRERGL